MGKKTAGTGSKGRKARSGGKVGEGSASAAVQVRGDSAAETAGVAPTEKLPTSDPGPPPEEEAPKRRPGGRGYQKKKQREEEAAEKAVEADRRAEQAPLASKVLTPLWSVGFRVTSNILKADHWKLSKDEAQELGDGLSAVLVKYVDLDILKRLEEEIAFVYMFAKVMRPRLVQDAEEAEAAEKAKGEAAA